MTVRCALIAGGRGTRMGGAPKGLAAVGGRRILDRLVEASVSALGTLPLLVANAPDAAAWRPGLEVAADLIPDAGALGGIYTAIVRAPAPVVCVAWDMPFVTPALLRRLAEGLARADAVVPTGPALHGLEPLCAGYGPGCADPIRAALAEGDFRAIGFHGRVRVEHLDPETVASFGDPATLFFNVNEPADLARAERLAAPR